MLFTINLINYIKSFTQLELTLDYFTNLYCINNIELDIINPEITFAINITSHASYTCSVNLMKLRENGGVTLKKVGDKNPIEIPQQYVTWKQDGNKLVSVFEFIHDIAVDKFI